MPLSSELTLASSPRAAADARRWVSDICERLERADLVECAELGVSELVANAVRYGAAPITCEVECDQGTGQGHEHLRVRRAGRAPAALLVSLAVRSHDEVQRSCVHRR